MNLKINPIKTLNGEITAPSSKSYSHRVFIAASLANGISIIKNPLTSGDVSVTIDLLQELGIKIIQKSNYDYIVEQTEHSFKPTKKILDCKNSGTSIRIFSVLALLIKKGLTFRGDFLKLNRPILPLLNGIESIGGSYKLTDEILHVRRIKKICSPIKIPGNLTSQFITALLMVCPILECNNTNNIIIETTTPITSLPYVKITIDVLNSFGIKIQENINEHQNARYTFASGQSYRAQNYQIPGDFSSAAFLIAGAVLSKDDSHILIQNLDSSGSQGDKQIIDLLCQMGAKIDVNMEENKVIIHGNTNKYPLHGIDIDISNIPDLFPILSVIGAFADGKTTLYNAKNLRIKESDRITVMARELRKMGVSVQEEHDSLTIFKCKTITGALIDHENDHRIAMALTILALYAEKGSQIQNIKIVEDSYPSFLEDLQKIGAMFVIS